MCGLYIEEEQIVTANRHKQKTKRKKEGIIKTTKQNITKINKTDNKTITKNTAIFPGYKVIQGSLPGGHLWQAFVSMK